MITRRTLLGAAAATSLIATNASATAADMPLRVLCWSEMTEPADVYPRTSNLG